MNKLNKRWRVAALSTLIAGLIVATPIAILSSTVSATTVQDKVIYVQASGQQKTGPYVEYIGGNGTTLTQSLSLSSGSCSSSKVSNPTSALLPMTSSYYGSGQPPYSGTPTPASVGSAQSGRVAETGVCVSSKLSPGNTIQPNEGLVFSIGTNALTAGRVFSQATIPLKRTDPTRGSLTGNLVLRRANQTVDTVPFTVPAAGTESENDTNDCPVISTGVVPAGDQFDQLEIQVDSPSSGSVAVVGPNCDNDNDADDVAVPTFYLDTAPVISSANQATFSVGGGQQSFSVTTTGYPTPALTNAAFSGCTPSKLPSSISFTTTNGSGTATISGAPVSGDGGAYTLCLNASNAGGTTTQAFTLTIDQTPAITSFDDAILPLPGSGSTSTFSVTATGSPAPSLSLDATPPTGCLATTPTGISFADIGGGSGTWTVGSNATAGTYCFQIDASNGVGSPATQEFTLVVTSPTMPYAAQVSAPSGDPVSASIALNSGLKSFSGFTASQGALGGSTTVTFTTDGTSTFTATVDVSFGDLTYCVPFASTTPPTCAATQVTIGPSSSSPTNVLPCSPTNMPTATSPGWCSESDSYSYPVVSGVQYTSISQVLFGAGDVTFSHT